MIIDVKEKFGGTVANKSRVNLFVLIVLISFGIYTLKLFSMQVIEGTIYRDRSISQRSKSKLIVPQRGEIYDREAVVPLVVNIDSFAVDVTPGEIKSDEYDTVIAKLGNYLSMPKAAIDKKIINSDGGRNGFNTVEIKANLDFSVISKIAENIIDLPGVTWRSKPSRNYVETGSISHIIGYVGNITKDEVNLLYNKGYTKDSIVGKAGIEKQYDEYLQGVTGSESRTVDVRGRIIDDTPIIEKPVMGKKLVLTIDMDIQTLAEKALGERIGAIVVLKPTTGEILGMVSYPYYDANVFVADDSSEKAKILRNPEKPMLNRAVDANFPPASTFKIIVSTAILAEKAFPQERKIDCTGAIHYGDRLFHCWIRGNGHGYLDLKGALANSCNIYYWTVGRDYLGVDKISMYAKMMGYGQSTQVDLPSQASGFVPTSEWKERRFHEKWLQGDTMNMSIGQGYNLVTPLQVADMMSMVVNGGKIYKPHLLKEIRDPVTDEVVKEIKPEVLFESDVPASVWKTLRTDLRYTISNGATRFKALERTVAMAGKTGTAEISQYSDKWHSWFVAYAPYNAPAEDAVVVACIVEAVNGWESWSNYASSIVFQGIFGKQTYEEAIDSLEYRYKIESSARR